MKTKRYPFLLLLILLIIAAPMAQGLDMLVYFGTHASGPGIGFSLARFNTDTGALTKPAFLIEDQMPAYFVIHPNGRLLYTCNSTNTLHGEGWISAYLINPKTGQLTLLNRQPSGGANPSYISLDMTLRYALVANYQGGNVAVFPINANGTLGPRTGFDQHTGHSINPDRQTQPYAHSVIVSPNNHYALCADLGTDRLYVYRFDEQNGTITPNKPPFVAVKPGSGPRHVIFHGSGRWVYLINELSSTISAFIWEQANGTLTDLQTISTLPPGYAGANTAAEIMIHPNGRFLYASNRGHDSLAVFSIESTTGKLTLVEHVPSRGHMPRNFSFDPTGGWILCTNHDSNNAVVFRVDPITGKLTPIGTPVEVPMPFCERFLTVVK